MSKESNENLGFLSRMSELGLRLKQSEDERLVLEEKFNKLLSARKSEEEMQLFMLRENYGQLLRQDKMRCDRNDMILQALANVESRASMLTAKTDRLRLLRQHYESYVSRHYPVLKKSVGRHRSVESLISDTCENTSQRSVSSSPRLTSSYSPSPFLRSPSITRRNSLVVSNSEILDPISYKIPNTSRINVTSHSSRRRLFEDSPKLDKSPDNKPAPQSFSLSKNYKKENVLKNSLPTFIVSTTDQPKVEHTSDNKRTTSGLFLDIPSYDYTENRILKDSSESEKTFVRTNDTFRTNISGKYDKLSPTRGSAITYSSKPSLTKPLTKSSSFSIGSSFSRNVSNYFPRDKRQSSLIRRPSFVYQTALSPQPLNRFQTPVTNDMLYSERPSYRQNYSFSERSKSPLSERAKSPSSVRDVSPTVIKSKSPLTVVDDIFKKYLINYDRRYLSDPISESKYGKYLSPLSHYDYTHTEDQRRNKLSNLQESKYDGRTPYFDDDISVSSRESVGSSLYSKPFGSHEILFTNDRQQLFHERNMSCFDDKKDWKEWNHYRTRYEYPPTLDSERPETKSFFMDNIYYPSTHEQICKDGPKSTSHKFSDDLPIKYSYPSNLYGESYAYNTSESNFGNTVRSKDSLISRERKISDNQNLTPKDTFRIPQTPKKVSFSNEFLYDDKSDTEVSSNVDEVAIPFDHVKSSEVTTEHTEALYSGHNFPDQDIVNLSRETEPYESVHTKLGIEKSKNPPADETLKANGQVSPTKYTEKENGLNSEIKEFKYSNESGETEKYGNSLENKDSNIKDLESSGERESQENSDKHPPNTESNIEQHTTEMPLEVETSNENHSSDSDKRGDTVENIEDIEREGIVKEGDDINGKSSTELKNSSSDESKTTEFIASSQYLDTQNETLPLGENEMQSAQNNIQLDNANLLTEKEITSHSFGDQDTTSQKYGSIENLQRQKPADGDTYDTSKADHEVGYNEEQLVYDKGPNEQGETYDDPAPQQYHDPNTYKDPDISENPPDYNREHYDQSQHQYDQYGPQQEGYVVQNDAPRQDNTQDVYGPESYGPKDYQPPEVYSGDQYEQQHIDYDGKSFRGSQQNIQDYPQPLPQQQYEDESYINQDQYEQQYKDGDQHYTPENMPEGYVAEQPYEGEYPPEYSQQQYDPNYQDSSQVPQNAPEQYKTDYNTAYQDGSQYGYDQVGSTYDEQYDHQQQPPYDQYEQQPADPAYDQYEQQPAKPAYDQYEQQPAEPAYDQYEQQPVKPAYDQYEQQPAEPAYDQYEQQPVKPAYDQYEQQPAEPAYDQYEQQPHEPAYDQYEQPHEPPYDQYEQQPTEPPYNQYEQQPSELPYDQYKQQPSENYDDQYQGAPDQYGNYNYTYDKTSPAAEQTYLGDERPNYAEETQPYDYNEPLQQPYDDVVQNQPYSENVPYEGTETMYPDEQNVYRDEQQVYETSVHAAQNLNLSQHEKLPSEYDYTHSPQPDDSQLSTQPDKPLYEPEALPYTQEDLSSREASEPAAKLNQILESDPESSVAQGLVTHEDSSDFDFSAGQK